jgi:peptidoglycan/LPS O-acetylase OafA/YrhL
VIASITLARFVYVSSTHPVWLKGVRIVVAYRLDACMFGVLAAWVKHFRPESWTKWSGWIGVLGLTILGFNASLPYTLAAESFVLHTIGFTITSVGAALLLPLLDSWKPAPAWGRPVVRLSLWSYSLYLVNMPVFALIFQHWFHGGPLVCAATFLTGSLCVAAFIYRFYEKPIIDLRDNRGSWRRLICFFDGAEARTPEEVAA